MEDMTHDETKYDLLKTELKLTQGQMDKFDQFSTTIKAWTITLWAASVGWSFQTDRKDVLYVSMLIVALFWVFDAINKTFRQDYRKRRNEVASALEQLFTKNSLAPDVVAPKLPTHRTLDAARNALALHIALPYILLEFVSLALITKF